MTETTRNRYSHRTVDGVRVSIDVDYRACVVNDVGECLLTLGTVKPRSVSSGHAPKITSWHAVSELEGVTVPPYHRTQIAGIRALLSRTAWAGVAS